MAWVAIAILIGGVSIGFGLGDIGAGLKAIAKAMERK